MARRTSDFEDAFASEGKVALKPGGERNALYRAGNS